MAAIEIKGKKPVCVSVNAPIDNGSVNAFKGVLSQVINDGHDEIHLFLSTPGGSVADGIAVYNFIRALPVPVLIYNIGTVDSIGNVIFQAATKRFASVASRFMFHGVGFDIQQARLELKDLRERISGLENDQGMIADILVRHCNLGVEDVKSLFLEAAFLSATEAHERGIVDEVCDIHLPQGLPIIQLVLQR